MIITDEQKKRLSSLKSERIRDVDESLVRSIKGVIIDGQESRIATLFKSKKNMDDDIHNTVASYVVISPENMVLGFYSLRCGELYRQIDLKKMKLCAEAWEGLKTLKANPALSPAEQKPYLSAIKCAISAGVSSPNEWKHFYMKKALYLGDKRDWSGSNIEQVSEVLPGIELQYFGINENAKGRWSSYGIPHRMGETLFWQCVVRKIEEIIYQVGCEYIYLFAADNKPDGNLVGYYDTVLHFEKNSDLNANKPHFDYKCRFMCQRIDTLCQNKEYFFEHLNSSL
jgi:hypothetical protein